MPITCFLYFTIKSHDFQKMLNNGMYYQIKIGEHDENVLLLQVAGWFGEKGIKELTTGPSFPGL